ncbi:porin [Pseudoalteromonas sp. KS88]|uniref:porin n=1 Tax=Pseudoalteromonas sp. KS88 TaxID=2109918 RepID=UPI0010819FA1|nr:porin [Pseudoalteromonas sp. KS88]TGE79763.1 porin [Pseudoalteromonas sp. KS88]
MTIIDKNQTLLIAASTVALLAPWQNVHGAEYNIYGKAEVQVANTDKGIMRYANEGLQIDAPFSRIGVKGNHKLTESLSAVFKYEVQVKGFEHDNTNDPFSSRNTYLGLKGNFGEVVIGRNDTRFKYSEGKVDNFNETQADIAQLLPGQDRLGDTLTYTSKSFSGAQLSLTYAPKDDSANNEAGFAATIIYGDRGLKNKDYYVAISHVDSLNNINATRIAGVLKQAQWQFGAIYQRSKSIDGSKSGNGYVVSASYKMGQWVPKVQFASDDSQLRHANDGSQWTGGVDYVFDKQTTAYLFYTDLDLDHQSDSSLALGLKYKF